MWLCARTEPDLCAQEKEEVKCQDMKTGRRERKEKMCVIGKHDEKEGDVGKKRTKGEESASVSENE